ncbi:MAG: HAMP domain-containing protein, partial [Burkholderiales bacterium]
MKSVHRGFSIKLLLVLILATTALLIGLSYILSLSLERGNRLLVAEMHQVLLGNNRQVAQQLLQGRADALNADLGRVQIAMEESSRALSHHLVRGGQMEESAPDLIRRLLRGEGLLSSAFFCDLPAGQCFVLNSDGQHRQSSPKLLLDLQHLLPQLTAPGVARWADLRPLPHLDGGWGVELLAGVYRGEQRVGVIGATIDLTRLNRLLQKNLAPQGSFVLLLDSQLRLLSGSDDALVHWIGPAQGPDSLAPLSSCANPSLLTAIKDLQLAAAGYEVVDLGVAPRLLVQQKLALLDWRLLLAIPQMPLADAEERIELASQTARQQVERLFLFSGIGMVLLVVSFFQLQLRWMTRPIRMLIDAANAFSSGRLERRVEVPRDKELGALLTTFNEKIGR